MLLSMTGYGRTQTTYRDKIIIVEIRSLNSKYTDLRLKMPTGYRGHEPIIRKLINDQAERGKVDVTIDIKSGEGDEEYRLNKPLFKKYYHELKALANELDMDTTNILPAVLKLPNIATTQEQEPDEDEWRAVNDSIQKTVDQFLAFRTSEGEAMEKDMRKRVKNIRALTQQLPSFEEERIEKLRQRLHQNLEEHLSREHIDENRFEQEILFYLEKMDITEEKVRLEQHCVHFLEELDKEVTLKGRKLSFITQEMGREINTMGAKAYSSGIQRLVVGMKDELEKIKEQVANSL